MINTIQSVIQVPAIQTKTKADPAWCLLVPVGAGPGEIQFKVNVIKWLTGHFLPLCVIDNQNNCLLFGFSFTSLPGQHIIFYHGNNAPMIYFSLNHSNIRWQSRLIGRQVDKKSGLRSGLLLSWSLSQSRVRDPVKISVRGRWLNITHIKQVNYTESSGVYITIYYYYSSTIHPTDQR